MRKPIKIESLSNLKLFKLLKKTAPDHFDHGCIVHEVNRRVAHREALIAIRSLAISDGALVGNEL